MMKNIRCFAIIGVLILLISSCANQESTVFFVQPPAYPSATVEEYFPQNVVEPVLDIGDGGFLSEEPCGPPCFLNITLGTTTENQTLELLQSWVDLQNCNSDDWTDGSLAGWLICGNVNFTFDDSGYVDGIGYEPITSILIGDVIVKYGNPDSVQAVFMEESFKDYDDITMVVMSLTFNKIKTLIVLPDQRGEIYNVEPATRIIQISYFGTDWESPCPDCDSWVGFGDYIGEYLSPYP